MSELRAKPSQWEKKKIVLEDEMRPSGSPHKIHKKMWVNLRETESWLNILASIFSWLMQFFALLFASLILDDDSPIFHDNEMRNDTYSLESLHN